VIFDQELRTLYVNMPKDDKCDWSRLVYEDFAYLHAALNTRFRDLTLAALKRIAAVQKAEDRITSINVLLRIADMFLAEYNSSVNAFLRRSRRSFVGFLKSCVAGKSDILETTVSNIDKIHTFLDAALNNHFMT
jgi:hypothetical protein